MQVELITITTKKDGTALKRLRYEVVIDGYSYPFNSKKLALSLYRQTLGLLERLNNETSTELPSQRSQQVCTEDTERQLLSRGFGKSDRPTGGCTDESRCTEAERAISDHISPGSRNRSAEERTRTISELGRAAAVNHTLAVQCHNRITTSIDQIGTSIDQIAEGVHKLEDSNRELQINCESATQSLDRIGQSANLIRTYNSILQDQSSNGSTISPSDFKFD